MVWVVYEMRKKYINGDSESMFKWRKKFNMVFNLRRITNQVLFLKKFKNLLNPLKILDYGCAFGDVLKIINVTNHNHDLYGVEVVKEVADRAKEEMPHVKIFNQSCGDKLDLDKNYFDLIFSFDMIEHVGDKKEIKRMYKEVDRILSNEGRFILVTPNCNLIMKIIYILTGNKYLIDSGFHPNQYTKNELVNEVDIYLDVHSVEKGYDLNFFKKLLSWFGIYKHICVVAGKNGK